MGIKCGIVGLPNVGKSTLFNALTQAQNAAAANYPFCTIDPNVGVVPVPDLRLKALADIVKPEKILPTTVEFVDIAGLVAGASKGEGLGNKFLAHIRETDAIAHVVRCFVNDDIVHVAGPHRSARATSTSSTPSSRWPTSTPSSAAIGAPRRTPRPATRTRSALRDLLKRMRDHLDSGKPARTLPMDPIAERPLLREFCLITLKPLMYVANVAEGGFDEQPVPGRREGARRDGRRRRGAGLRGDRGRDRAAGRRRPAAFLEELGLHEPGLDRVIRAAYHLLGLLTFFTAGAKEVRAWTTHAGALAPQAAGEIHTDFEKGFIRAEVIAYDDFIACKGEQGAKEAGKMRLEGKEYVVREGDVMHFRFNV